MVETFTDLQKSRETRTFFTGFAVPSEKKKKTEVIKLAYVKISLKQINLLSIVMFKIF